MAALNSKVTKAVIPVAGLGTRMLPATKAIPKEMLPLVDKPLIQYVVNECIAAGITEIVLVTHSSKNSIENHFDTSFELEAMLEKTCKTPAAGRSAVYLPAARDYYASSSGPGERSGSRGAVRPSGSGR